MTTYTFANGQTLTSTALTKAQIEQAFQMLTCQVLGFNPGLAVNASTTIGSASVTCSPTGIVDGMAVIGPGVPTSATVSAVTSTGFTLSVPATATGPAILSVGADTGAFNAVRVGWQTQGQPFVSSPSQDAIIVMAATSDDQINRVRNKSYTTLDEATLSESVQYTRVWLISFTLYGPSSLDHARLLKSALFMDWSHDILAALNLYAVLDIPDPRRVPEKSNGQWFEHVDFSCRFNEGVTETTTTQSIASVEVILQDATHTETIIATA
jgi:hypothetical protein